jgi:hypothetical protein
VAIRLSNTPEDEQANHILRKRKFIPIYWVELLWDRNQRHLKCLANRLTANLDRGFVYESRDALLTRVTTPYMGIESLGRMIA